MGPTGPYGEYDEIPTPDFPNPAPTVIKIYARAGGHDSGANALGTLAKPYRTFQRAIRDVPFVVPAGYRYIVDITGIGVENFPAGYAMPPIHGAGQLDQVIIEADERYTRFRGAVSVYAEPKPFSGVPLADTIISNPGNVASITQNPDDKLITITLNAPRFSWGGNALRGAIFTAASSVTFNSYQQKARVASSTTTTIVLTTFTLPTGNTFSLMEESATFDGSAGDQGHGAFQISNVDSFAFAGIKFTSTIDGPASTTVAIRSPASAYAFAFCSFGGITIQGCAAFNPVFDGCAFIEGSDIGVFGVCTSFRRTIFFGTVDWFNLPETGFIYGNQCIWDTCDPIGDVVPFVPVQPGFDDQAGGGLGVWLQFSRVQNGTSHGVVAKSGGTIQFSTIQNNSGDAVNATQSRAPLRLTDVVGAGNAGFGIHVTQNSVVNIDVDVLVTGAAGDIKVANNAVRTYANFRGVAPINNENDLAAGALSQMCRLYQT